MSYISAEAKDYIMRKHKEKLYEESTGLSVEEIKEGADAFYPLSDTENHAMLKAKAFDYILSNTRIAVDEHDWYIGIAQSGERTARFALSLKWILDVRKKLNPDLVKEELRHFRKTHLLYLDPWHHVPDWEAVLELGIPGLLERAEKARKEREESQGLTPEQWAYFESIKIEYESMLKVLARVRDHALTKDHPKCKKIAQCMDNLYKGAPTNFYECLQLIWIFFMCVQYVDGFSVRSFGNLDQMLYPYYQKDIESGNFTKDDIGEFIAGFYMQMQAARYIAAAQPFYMGGTNKDGSSGINELSYLMLDIYDKLDILDPKIQVKINRNTPQPFIDKLLEMIRGGHNSIVFVGEPGMVRAMVKNGYTEEEARTCDVKGCYEYAPRGTTVGTCNGLINLPQMVVLALNDGYDPFNKEEAGIHTGKAEDFKTFEEFYQAVIDQAIFCLNRCQAVIAAYEAHASEIYPTPIFSATMQSSLDKAFDAFAGGAVHNDCAVQLASPGTLADSLAMIYKYVFRDQELTLAEYRDILNANWEGHEAFRLKIIKDEDKWGNNKKLPDAIFKHYTETLAKIINAQITSRYGKYSTCLHGAETFYTMGHLTAATPDGRFAADEFSKNASPVQGMNRSGPTGAVASILKLDTALFMGDSSVDLSFNPNAVQGQEGIDAMRALLMTYVDNYGHALQINVLSAEQLRDAQKNPEKYKDLQIRVCGWNVLWNSLPKNEQDYYIRQAEAS